MNRLPTLLLCLLISFPIYKAAAQKIHLGMQAGVVFANAYIQGQPEEFKDVWQYYPMFSLNLNAVVYYQGAGIWGVDMEPGYIQKGGIRKAGGRARVQLNYLQLPVILNINLIMKVYVSLGPEVAYLINAKSFEKSGALNVTGYYQNRTEFSGLFGINYCLSQKMDLGIRYNHGFTWTSKIPYTDEFGYLQGEIREYNQYFQVGFRYKPGRW